MFRIVKNRAPGVCVAHGCLNPNRPGKDQFCSKHRKRYNKEKHPIQYTFHILKSNAIRRGHEFLLTLEEFTLFCSETGYMDKKGRTATSASIDRIDVTKGYEITNLQILTLSENTTKRNNEEYGCPF